MKYVHCLPVIFLLLAASGRTLATGLYQADTTNQKYYNLLKAYREGRKDYTTMPWLAKTAKDLNQKELADEIAHDYINNHLLTLNDEKLYTKENLIFIAQFTTSSKNRSFKLFYPDGIKVNKVMADALYARRIVDNVITIEEIHSKLSDAGGNAITEQPDWITMQKRIASEYDRDYADRTILNAQLQWYENRKDTTQLIRYNVMKIEREGLDTVGFGRGFTNNMIYYLIFKHSDDRDILNKAVKWMETLLKIEPENPAYMDTYANLLYKVGRKQEALIWEEKSFNLDANNKETLEAWNKMKRGEQTWPDK